MVKFVKSLLFVLASIVMTLCLIYLPNVSGPVSITFVGVLSCYLGIDVADTIIKSSEMEQGKYKDIHKHKYVISLICLSVMIGVCMFIPDKTVVNTALTSLISSVLIVIGILIAGLEGNKIAANIDGGSKSTTRCLKAGACKKPS